LPEAFKSTSQEKLVVWTPAIPQNSDLLRYFKNKGFNLKKRAEVLGIITRNMETVAVAGTHGKTTTSSIIAHLLKSSGKNTAAFLGGLTQNYNNNFILHDEGSHEAPIVVVEADEFDRSFLHLHPNVSVVTSMDADHLDIYGDNQHLIEGFRQFIELTEKGGRVFIQENAFEKLKGNDFGNTAILCYGLEGTQIKTQNIQAGTSAFSFDYTDENVTMKALKLHVPGFHNIENAVAAIAVARHYGLSEDDIRNGIASYKGVKRRFEIIHQAEDLVFIDDYAHHPEEITAFLRSVKAMYPEKKLTAVFQPHLFTRTRDFAAGFSESLSLADEVLLLEIYPARELPIPGVKSRMLLEKISSKTKMVLSKEALIPYLEKSKPEVLVTIGAGDIDRMVPQIENWIRDGKR
jgi:UDP-N-acetylmuramate--alanine ligase